MVDCVSVGVLPLSSESVLHLIKLHLTALCRQMCLCVCVCVSAYKCTCVSSLLWRGVHRSYTLKAVVD